MIISPLMRAKRVLKDMAHFRRVFDGDIPLYATAIPITPDESLIGVYENNHNQLQKCVAVTDRRLLVEREGEWESVAYSDVIDVQTPSPSAAMGGELLLAIKCTERIARVPIEGSDGRFFDLFEFSRFVNRVRADQIPNSIENNCGK